MSSKHSIDSSHGLVHSMNVLHFTRDIYDSEVYIKPQIKEYERIIYVSAILHDMCDKKYVKEEDGIREIESFLHNKIDDWEIDVVKKIISTMSYSKVKVSGFPVLGIYQDAYHIVRESDLLAAYDFDRCMCYRLNKTNSLSIESTYEEACELFESRIFKHNVDNLFVTKYAKCKSVELHENSIKQIHNWRVILNHPKLRSIV